MALGSKAEIQWGVWRRKWRQAVKKGASPEACWGRLKRLVGRSGNEMARDLLLLWSYFQDEAGPGGGAETDVLEEIIAAIPPEDGLVSGWLEAWAGTHNRPESAGTLHDKFAARVFADGGEQFWAELTSGRTGAIPVEERRRMFEGLHNGDLFRYYYSAPDRAARLTKVLDDQDLELLQKAGHISVTDWTSDGAAVTVGRCMAEVEHAGSPPAPKRMSDLNQSVAEAWVRRLAQTRLRHAVSLGGADAWNVVPCTFKDPWALVYQAGLIETAVVLMEEAPSVLQSFSEHVLTLLCQRPDALAPVIRALLTGLTQNVLAWPELPESFRTWALQQLESDSCAELARSTLAGLPSQPGKPTNLPDEVFAALIPAVLRSFEEEPQAADGESMEEIIQELTGRLCDPEGRAATAAPAVVAGSDWAHLFRFDPTSSKAHRLLPHRLTKTVILWFADQIHSRWKLPSGQVSAQAAVADIAAWDATVVREGAHILTFALGPVFQAPGIRGRAFRAAVGNELAVERLRGVADRCLESGGLVHPGVLAASSRTADELAQLIERVLHNGSGQGAHNVATTALRLWAENRAQPADLPALLQLAEGLRSGGVPPHVLHDPALVDAYLGLVAAGSEEAEDVRNRVRQTCEILGVPDGEVGGAIRSALTRWCEREPDGAVPAALWALLEDEAVAGRLGPTTEPSDVLLGRAFAAAVRDCERAEDIVGRAETLTGVFGVPPGAVVGYARAPVADWLGTSPSADQIGALLAGLGKVVGPELDPSQTEELRAFQHQALAGIEDFWELLGVAAELGLPWDVLPGDPYERLRERVSECSFDEVFQRTSAMAAGGIRSRVMADFCRVAPPEVYEDMRLRDAYAPDEGLAEWCAQFAGVKLAMVRQAAGVGAEPPAPNAKPLDFSAACDILETLTWHDRPNVIDADLCLALSGRVRAAFDAVTAPQEAARPTTAARGADLLFLVWSQNWAGADSDEEANTWAAAWRDGVGEALTAVFEEWPDDPECRRRAFACRVVSALLEPEGRTETALGGALIGYRNQAPELGFGAPIYVGDSEAALGGVLRNYRLSILRRVVDGHTELELDEASRKLLDGALDEIMAEVKRSCTVSATGPDPFRAGIFLPGDRYRPGGGVVEIAAERGCGLPEEIALLLLLHALGTTSPLGPDAMTALLREILGLDLDLANAGVGAVLRTLIGHALGQLVPRDRRGIVEHLTGLRWRTGFGGRTDLREAALQTPPPQDLTDQNRTWAYCARLAQAAYDAFERPFSQNRADDLNRLMADCQDWLTQAEGGVEGLLLRGVAVRAGLEAVAWMSDTTDLSALWPAVSEANRNPYLTPEDFKAHLDSIHGAARGVAEGWTYLLWRGYNDGYDPKSGELRSPKISETLNFGTTLLVKVRDHKWRPRLIKYQVQPAGSETRELSIGKLHAYRLYVEHTPPHTRLARHLLHVDTVMPLHLFGLPASDMPSKASGYVELGTGEPIPEVTAWQMPSMVMEYLQGESLVEIFCELTESASRNVRELVQSYWPDPGIRKALTSDEAYGKVLRWCEYFWAMYRSELLDVAEQLDRLLRAMALGKLVSLDFKPHHVFLCGHAEERTPVLIDVDSLHPPGSEITILNRAVEQSPYREPQYSGFLAATRKFGRMGPLQRPSENLPFQFTPLANYFVANLILYEFLSMTPGLQAAPVDVPEFVSRQKGEVMDEILADVSEEAGARRVAAHGRPQPILRVGERVLADWPDFLPGADPREVLQAIGFDPDCVDIDQQMTWVKRLVGNAVDPPPRGTLSHPPWVYAIIPASWVSGSGDLTGLRGYDVLHVVLRLLAEGVTDIDPQLVLGESLTVPVRTDEQAMQRFHRRCSRFYVSIGEGGREFWRRSRGKMLEKSLVRKGQSADELMSTDVIVTFGLSEQGAGRRRARQEGAVCNFALRFAPVDSLRQAFKGNALTMTAESGETVPLTVQLEHGDLASGRAPCWDVIAGALEDSADLERVLHRANLESFLSDPMRTDFALGIDPEAVALGRPGHATTLTRRQLHEGWSKDLDLTPYLPTGAGGPVYVRVETTPFMFRVTWEPEARTGSP